MTEEEIKEVQVRLGKKIQSLRKKHTSNYMTFAEDIGLPRESIHRIEKGANTTLKTLIIVANALDIKLSDVFREIGM